LGTWIFVNKRIISAVKRVESVNDRMSYIILRGRLFHIIVLNVHAPTEDKIDDVKNSFYEELRHISDKFRIYHMNILLGDFNAKETEKTFLHRQLGMKIFMKLVMIMECSRFFHL
jgi:hydroxypyruvate isomerase